MAAALLEHGAGQLTADPELARELYVVNSGAHRRKLRAWQMLCALAPVLMTLPAARLAPDAPLGGLVRDRLWALMREARPPLPGCAPPTPPPLPAPHPV